MSRYRCVIGCCRASTQADVGPSAYIFNSCAQQNSSSSIYLPPPQIIALCHRIPLSIELYRYTSATAYAFPITNGSNGLSNQSSACCSAVPRCSTLTIRRSFYQGLSSIAIAHSIPSYVNGYIGIGFTKQQWEKLNEIFSSFRSPAPPPAPPSTPLAALQPCTQAPSKPPHQQLIPAPIPTPVTTRSYPPTPSIETIEEVEHKQIPLRNIRPISKKLGASKTIHTSRLPFNEIRVEWPTKFGGSNLCFSRDEDLDAWYTTMLNTHANELATRALPNQAQRHAARRHHFLAIRYRVQILATFFDFFDFLTFHPAMDLTLPSYHLIFIDQRSSLAMPHPKHRTHYSQVFYVVVVAHIAVAKSQLPEKKSWRSATSQNRTCSYQPPPPTPPTSCSCQRSMVYGIQDVIWIVIQYALCAMRWIAL